MKDNENLMISCKNCSIRKQEKIENIVNFSSEWIKNDFKYNIRFRSEEEINYFERFLKNAEKHKKAKSKRLNESFILLENYRTKYSKTKEKLNETINNILNIFYKNLKTEQNLIFLAKILIFSYNMYDSEIEIKNNFKEILSLIYKCFENEKIEEFFKIIDIEKNSFMTFIEINELKQNIQIMFEPKKKDISEFEWKKNYIQKNIEYSSVIKKYIDKEKIEHPDKYIEIDKEINNLENISHNITSKNIFTCKILRKFWDSSLCFKE